MNLIIPGRLEHIIPTVHKMFMNPTESESLLYKLLEQVHSSKWHQKIIFGYPVDAYFDKLNVIVDIVDEISPIENSLFGSENKEKFLSYIEEEMEGIKIFRIKGSSLRSKDLCTILLKELYELILKLDWKNKQNKIIKKKSKYNRKVLSKNIKSKESSYSKKYKEYRRLKNKIPINGLSPKHSLESKISLANKMISNPTKCEAIIYKRLIEEKIKFKKQQIIGGYIADILLPDNKVIIEIDGGVHEDREQYDNDRDCILSKYGYTTFRIQNETVIEDTEKVIDTIKRLYTLKIINNKKGIYRFRENKNYVIGMAIEASKLNNLPSSEFIKSKVNPFKYNTDLYPKILTAYAINPPPKRENTIYEKIEKGIEFKKQQVLNGCTLNYYSTK